MIRKLGVILVVVLSISVFGCAAKMNPDDEAAALKATRQWLTLMDAEKYAESWREAAIFLQQAVTEDEWLKSMELVRTPMGKVVSRELIKNRFRTLFSKAPKGKYFVIEFKTVFTKNDSASELVTQMLEEDGRWRVAGYHLE